MKHIFNLPFVSLVSLLTIGGVVLHDTYTDRLSLRVIAPPAVVARVDAGGHLNTGVDHTHVERVALRGFHQMARRMPQTDELRHYLSQRNTLRNRTTLGSLA